jgi:hypothetical protein
VCDPLLLALSGAVAFTRFHFLLFASNIDRLNGRRFNECQFNL